MQAVRVHISKILLYINKIKKDRKDQESIQSSTTPDPGHYQKLKEDFLAHAVDILSVFNLFCCSQGHTIDLEISL